MSAAGLAGTLPDPLNLSGYHLHVQLDRIKSKPSEQTFSWIFLTTWKLSTVATSTSVCTASSGSAASSALPLEALPLMRSPNVACMQRTCTPCQQMVVRIYYQASSR